MGHYQTSTIRSTITALINSGLLQEQEGTQNGASKKYLLNVETLNLKLSKRHVIPEFNLLKNKQRENNLLKNVTKNSDETNEVDGGVYKEVSISTSNSLTPTPSSTPEEASEAIMHWLRRLKGVRQINKASREIIERALEKMDEIDLDHLRAAFDAFKAEDFHQDYDLPHRIRSFFTFAAKFTPSASREDSYRPAIGTVREDTNQRNAAADQATVTPVAQNTVLPREAVEQWKLATGKRVVWDDSIADSPLWRDQNFLDHWPEILEQAAEYAKSGDNWFNFSKIISPQREKGKPKTWVEFLEWQPAQPKRAKKADSGLPDAWVQAAEEMEAEEAEQRRSAELKKESGALKSLGLDNVLKAKLAGN
jgi:hypothetical protein